ncbi:MAG: WD40 repeat domain-containing protein [Planctomycetes bacterium]|nr:WD40 repeat domain-containing protein [Planctomycetota bacterium]
MKRRAHRLLLLPLVLLAGLLACILRPWHRWPPPGVILHPPEREEAKQRWLAKLDDYQSRRIRAWSLEELSAINDIEYSPDGKYLVLINARFAYVIDSLSFEVLSLTLPAADSLAVHPGGEFFACGEGDATVSIRAIPTGRVLQRFEVDVPWNERSLERGAESDARSLRAIQDLVFSPDGRWLALRPGLPDHVWLYRTEDWSFHRVVHTDRVVRGQGLFPISASKSFGVQQLVFTADSKELIVVDRRGPDSSVGRRAQGGGVFYDVETGEQRGILVAPPEVEERTVNISGTPTDGRYIGFAWNPATRRVIDDRVPWAESWVSIWTDDLEHPAQYPPPYEDHWGLLSPDGRWLVTLGHAIALWDVEKKETYFVAHLPRRARYMAISPDSTEVAVVQGWNTIYIFDIVRGDAPAKVVRPFEEEWAEEWEGGR